MKLPDRVYLILKWIMLLAVPVCVFITSIIDAIGTGNINSIITAVIGGLGTLAGVIIKISDSEYRKEIEG